MSRLITIITLCSLIGISYAVVTVAEGESTAIAERRKSESTKLAIVPLVIVKPGESEELLLSTWCTVGVTRGGGFGLTEMRDGFPITTDHDAKQYSRDGVTISVPSFQQETDFAASPEFAALREQNLDAFKITVSATHQAEAGMMEMHLVDKTCTGHCKVDFRVLVVK